MSQAAETLAGLEANHPKHEEYFAGKIIAQTDHFFGAGGRALIEWYSYFRWLDNSIDRPGDNSSKLDLLDRQHRLLTNELPPEPYPMERVIHNQNLDFLSEDLRDCLHVQASILVATIRDDLLHTPCEPRTGREIRHYNWRTLLSCFRAVSILINKRDLTVTRKMMDFFNGWNTIGTLLDLGEDFSQEQLQVPFTPEECIQMADMDCTGRKTLAQTIYSPDRFSRVKSDSLNQMTGNIAGVFETNLPAWQKPLVFLYFCKSVAKGYLKTRYPGESVI